MMNATAGAKTIKIALEEPSEREIKEMSLNPERKYLYWKESDIWMMSR